MPNRPKLLAALLLLICVAASTFGQAPDYASADYWLSKIEEWRKAAEQHRAGEKDSAAAAISGWPNFELEFSIALFKKLIQRPLNELATPQPGCDPLTGYLGIKKEADKNYWLKRGALLHADIAMLQLETGSSDPDGILARLIKEEIKGGRKTRSKTCGYVRLLNAVVWDLKDKGDRKTAFIEDGRSVYASEGRHMEFGRFLLESVTPQSSQDEMVRKWYIATSAYGLSIGRPAFINEHLKDAVDTFPTDPLILLYAGMLHETYATSRYQNASRIPAVKYMYGLKRPELELARDFFRRAVKADPKLAEARLRLGYVLGLLGNHREAVSELQAARSSLTGSPMSYYAALFLGNEQAMLGREAEARAHFECAVELYPNAQSPLVALSRLAQSSGDMEQASLAIERAFAVAANNSRQEDPRREYDLVPAHTASELIMEMRKMFRELSR